MCLKSFEFNEPPYYFMNGIGFKVCIKRNNKYHSVIFSPDGEYGYWYVEGYDIGEIYYATVNIAETLRVRDKSSLYPTGFHIFQDYKTASRYKNMYVCSQDCVIVEVAYTEVFGRGIDESGFECILAKRMRIIKEVKQDE